MSSATMRPPIIPRDPSGPVPEDYRAQAGTFSKSLPGGLSLNFSTSGGAYCSDACPYKGGACYAERIAKRKRSIHSGGEYRERLGFARTCLELAADLAARFIVGDPVPWVRLSAFGSTPNRPLSDLEREAFGYMLAQIPEGVPVHIPAETEAKAARLQAIADDTGRTVRVSVPSLKRADRLAREGRACSTVWTTGATKAERIANAEAWAASKPHATVCPAIGGTAKCGDCVACSEASGLVIYPQH